jgi:pyruvate dehydrogenase E1 component alpha subunit
MKKREVKPGVAPAPPDGGEFSLIPHEKLLDLYAAMLKCRMIAKAVPIAKKDGRKRSILVSEAVTVGVGIDLLAGDAISPVASDLTPCVVKGVAAKALQRWWSSPSTRVPRVLARANVISPAASPAARLEAALRLAAHFRSTDSESVVVFFAGPGLLQTRRAASPTLSQRLLGSCLSRAAAQLLPILFVMQSETDADNFLPISLQSGVPGIVVDRDDAVAVYRVASEALTHARRGNGPTLIHSKPWPLNGHRHKTRKHRDPIGKMELYLTGKRLAYRSVKDKIIEEFAAELA